MFKVNKLILTDKWLSGIQLFWGLWFVSMMIFSKYGTSMSIIGFGVLGLYSIITHYEVPARKYFEHWLKVDKYSVGFFALTLIFWITVFGFFNSDNTQYWLSRVRIRLPFLALPLVFYWIPWSSKSKQIIVLTAIFLMFCSSSFVALRYLMNFDEFNKLLERGKAIPVPMKDHVRYAQLQAYIVLSGIYWLLKDASLKKSVRNAAWICVAMLFLYIHLLAVRSGILILYAGLMVFLVLNIRKIKVSTLLLILASLAATAFFSVKYVPSVKQKIGYMLWEYEQYRQGERLKSSDSGRWLSYEAGIRLAAANPVFGIGPGDMENEVKAYHALHNPGSEQALQPHNQFLHTLTGSGIVGLAIFLLMWILILRFSHQHQNAILTAMIFATFASFMVESPLETARGTAIIAFWLSFWMAESIPDDKKFRMQLRM